MTFLSVFKYTYLGIEQVDGTYRARLVVRYHQCLELTIRTQIIAV